MTDESYTLQTGRGLHAGDKGKTRPQLAAALSSRNKLKGETILARDDRFAQRAAQDAIILAIFPGGSRNASRQRRTQ
jgi:hypothetical protein